MIKAFTTAQKNSLRTRPQRAKWFLAIHRPEPIYSCTIAANADAHWPTISLVLNAAGATGTLASTASNMTAFIGSTAGASDKGRVRLRDTITSTNAKIAESGCGLINFQTGDHFTVMNLFEPWIMHMRYSTGFNKWRMDYSRAYTDQFSNWVPNIIMGPPAAAIARNGNPTIEYIGTSAQFIGTTFAAASWVYSDEASVWVNDASAMGAEHLPIQKVYTTGTGLSDGRYTSLCVLGANGAANITRRLAWVFDDDSQLPEVEFATITGGLESGGYDATITVRNQDGAITNLDHRAEIAIFEEASFGANFTEIGGNYPSRENIVFRGWVDEESITVNPFSGTLALKARGLQGVLNRTQAGGVFHFENSADEWVKMPDLTIDKVTMDIINYRSTISDITDTLLPSATFTMEGGDGYMFAQDLPRGSVWNQLTSNYTDKGILGYFSSDMQGNLYGTADAQITGGSAALPVSMHIRDEDKRDVIQISTKQYAQRSLIRLLSVASQAPDKAVKFGAEAPGLTPGYFGTEHEISRGIVSDNQDTLIIWSGNMLAKQNMKYDKVVVPLAPYARIDSVPQSRITMSLSGANNPRGIEWNDKGFFPIGTTIQYNSMAGLPQVTLTMEEIVDGVSGSAFTFVRPEAVETPDPAPLPPAPPVETTPITSGDGFGTVYVMTTGGLARTLDLSAASPTWTNIHPDSTINYWDFILDPWNPKTVAWLASEDGLYKSTNMDQTTPSWTLKLSRSAIATGTGTDASGFKWGFKMVGSINQQNYLCFVFGTGNGAYMDVSNQVKSAFTEDGGDSWTYATVFTRDGFPEQEIHSFLGGLDIVPHTVGGSLRLYCGITKGAKSTTTDCHLARSDNKGTSWTTRFISSEPSQMGAITHFVQAPYLGNEDGSEVIINYTHFFADEEFARSTNSGVAFSVLSNIDGGFSPGEATINSGRYMKRFFLERATNNTNRVYAWENNGNSSAVYLRTSTTGITGTFTRQSMNGITRNWRPRASGGFPYDDDLFYLVTSTDGIFATIDGGTEWLEKTGDFNLATSAGVSVPDAGAATSMTYYPFVIVPLWVDA